MTDTKPDRPGNQGAKLLADAIGARGVSANAAGKIVKAPTGCMSRLLSGERKPSRELSVALHAAFGVPPGAWDQALPGEPDEPETTFTKDVGAEGAA